MYRFKKLIRKSLKPLYLTMISLFLVIGVLAVLRLVFVNPTQERSLFGHQFFIVLSDSMKPEFEAGDLIITRQAQTSDLAVGDIITFRSIDPMSFNEVITHEIVGITTFQNELAFTTRGVNNDTNDVFPALSSSIIGHYQMTVPMLGSLFRFLGTVYGYVLLILMPFVLLASYELRTFLKYLKAKKAYEVLHYQEEKERLLREIEALKEEHQRHQGQPKKINT